MTQVPQTENAPPVSCLFLFGVRWSLLGPVGR